MTSVLGIWPTIYVVCLIVKEWIKLVGVGKQFHMSGCMLLPSVYHLYDATHIVVNRRSFLTCQWYRIITPATIEICRCRSRMLTAKVNLYVRSWWGEETCYPNVLQQCANTRNKYTTAVTRWPCIRPRQHGVYLFSVSLCACSSVVVLAHLFRNQWTDFSAISLAEIEWQRKECLKYLGNSRSYF